MKFFANRLNGNFLRDVLPPSSVDIDGVLAAIAYGSNSNNEKDDFLGHCIRNGYRLDLWMRYDHTVPVAVPLLKRLLKHHQDNIFCKLIPDYLHSKVIWWKGYGAYIGSANLTDRAWQTNIEAGIFLTDDDLQLNNIHLELEGFFENLRNLEVAFPLTEEVVREMEQLELKRRAVLDLGRELRKVPEWSGPAFVGKDSAVSRGKETFRKEWQETLTTLRTIGEKLTRHRPAWVKESVPIAWQIDQFLHAYYYNKVGNSNLKPYEEYFRKNNKNPNAALTDALVWWKDTSVAPSNEDKTFYENAPYIRDALSKAKILLLTEQEFVGVCSRTHATRDHVIKMDLATLGRPDLESLGQVERLSLYAAWLLKQRNAKGWSVLELLKFVLYGGDDDVLWERLYSAARDHDYALSHYGLNSIAELVGWARPEVAPPRNGRTSKALRALGFDVHIY